MALSVCTGCDRRFASLGPFDKHQKTQRDGRNTVICLDPASVGLVRKGDLWQYPASDKPITYKPVEPTESKVYACRTCGGAFEGSGGRGRPPVTCDRPGCGGKGKAI